MYSILLSVYRSMIERVVFCPCFGRQKGLELKSHNDQEEEEDDIVVNERELQVDISDVTIDPQYSSGQFYSLFTILRMHVVLIYMEET